MKTGISEKEGGENETERERERERVVGAELESRMVKKMKNIRTQNTNTTMNNPVLTSKCLRIWLSIRKIIMTRKACVLIFLIKSQVFVL